MAIDAVGSASLLIHFSRLEGIKGYFLQIACEVAHHIIDKKTSGANAGAKIQIDRRCDDNHVALNVNDREVTRCSMRQCIVGSLAVKDAHL
jgi:hypothetical protein